NSVRNTTTSMASNAMNSRRFGSASANQGSSHRLNCGEYTLFDSRNTTRIGNPSVHRGQGGARRALTTQITTTHAMNSTREATLITLVFSHPWPVASLQAAFHRLFQLAERELLLWEK